MEVLAELWGCAVVSEFNGFEFIKFGEYALTMETLLGGGVWDIGFDGGMRMLIILLGDSAEFEYVR